MPPTIGIIGSAVPPYDWSVDVDMQTTDGINYTLSNYTFITGEVKFRQNHDWNVNWGNTGFPGGTGISGGPNIPVTGGTYNVTFNRLTGEYNFVCAQCYCTGSLYYYGCSYDTAIDNFSLSNIHQVATGCGGGFSDYTSLTANLAQGESYMFNLSSTSSQYMASYDFVGIWIDFNDNGSFEDAGELIFASANGGVYSGVLSVPVTAPLGNHRMRVRLKNNYDNTPLSLNNSCTTFYYGETQDYTVNIAAAPSCSGLSSLSVTGIGTSSATVNWSCNNCTGPFVIEYGPVGFTPGTGSTAGTNGTIISAESSPITLNGLTSSTGYDVYVRRNCEANGFSQNFGPLTFTTKYDYCGTITAISCGTEITASIPAGEGGVFPGTGKELIYLFTPTQSGGYTFTVTNADNNNNSITYFMKDASDGCNENNWIYLAQFYYSNTGTILFGNLEAGHTYYLMLDASSPQMAAIHKFKVDCYVPSAPCEEIETTTCGVTKNVVIPTGVGSFNTVTGGYMGREKIYSFTPGITGPYSLTIDPASSYSTVGVFFKKASDGCTNDNWHFINNHIDQYNKKTLFIGTLIAGKEYLVMLDNSSLSETTRSFQVDCYTPSDPCNNIETISCGTDITYEVPRGIGSFVPDACLNSSETSYKIGKEKIFQFTPTTSGRAALLVKNESYNLYTGFFFKEASSGCNNNDWQCITYFNSNIMLLPGTLTAGTTYYIMADVWSLDGGSVTFNITCPEEWNACNSITPITCATPVSASLPVGIGNIELYEDSYSNYSYNGKEIIYSFTATVSGTHQLNVTETDYKPPYYNWRMVNYYIKDADDGCNGNGWTKITSAGVPQSQWDSPIYLPYSLVEGHTYYIMLDADYYGANQTFFITCPEISYPCDHITNISCNTEYTFSNPTGLGQFTPLYTPNTLTGFGGKESLFEFTPSITGTYQLEGVSSLDYANVGYFVKEASDGCNNNNWKLISYLYPGQSITIPITLTAGTSYYIMADGATIGTTFKIVCPEASYNPCADITTIAACNTPVQSINSSGLGRFTNLFNNNDPYLVVTPGKERVFSFTPATDGVYGLQVDAGGSGQLAYFIKKASEGCDASGWLFINSESYGYGFQAKIPMELKAGGTYYIMTDAANTSGADQTFKIICPSADPCNDITPITVCGWQNSVETTIPAGINPYLLEPCYDVSRKIDGGAKIFSYSPAVSGYLSITENGSYYADQYFFIKDATLGCGANDWTCMTTDYYNTYYSPFPLLEGHTYYILVAKTSSSTEERSFSFYLNCISAVIVQYADKDGDGYGDPNNPLYGYSMTKYGYTFEAGDCDDNNPNIHPGAVEICGNHIDDNCNGLIDEDCCVLTMNCPDNILANTTILSCGKRINTSNPVIVSSCGLSKLTWTMTGATIGNSPATGINNVGSRMFNTGVTTITYSATDASGNTATCSFTVTIVDNIKPVIVCPFNIKQDVGKNSCNRNIDVPSPFIFDNCGVVKLTWTMSGATNDNSPATGINYIGNKNFNAGVTTVTYTAADASGNTSTCSFTVTITETVLPNISCPPNKTVNVDSGQCYATNVNLGNPVTSDNCAVLSVTNNAPVQFSLGATMVTWTVTDVSGNKRSCQQKITVVDNIAPVIINCALPKSANANNNCRAAVPDFTNSITATDNCTAANRLVITQSPSAGTMVASGVTTIIVTVKDASGNSATCSTTFTVKDNTSPTITCPANITINAGTNCSKNVSVPNPATNDNCGITKLSWVMTGATTGSSSATGINYVGTKSFNTGLTTITYTARDAANNVTSCSFTVRVNSSSNCTIASREISITTGEVNPKNSAMQNNIGFAVKVFPNPTGTYFNLQMVSGNNEKLEITIFDVSGKMLKKLNAEPYQTVRFGDDLISGFYLVEARQGSDRQIMKVVKQ